MSQATFRLVFHAFVAAAVALPCAAQTPAPPQAQAINRLTQPNFPEGAPRN